MSESPSELLIFCSESAWPRPLTPGTECARMCWWMGDGVLKPVSGPGCGNCGWQGHCWVLGALAQWFSSPVAQWHYPGGLFKIMMPTPHPSIWGWTWALVFLLFYFLTLVAPQVNPVCSQDWDHLPPEVVHSLLGGLGGGGKDGQWVAVLAPPADSGTPSLFDFFIAD